jgi:glycosyltransferase involved in cell wall biosynthesis
VVKLYVGVGGTMGRLNVEGMVSVVLGIYNGKPYLLEAVKSVLEQSYTNIELILVDDGSTDDGLTEVAEYCVANSDISVAVYLTNGPNHFTPMGGLWPYIVGAGNSRGEYLSFHSQDDISHYKRFEKLVEGIGNHSLVYSDVTHIDTEGHTIKSVTGNINDYFREVIMRDDDGAAHLLFSSTMFRKDEFFRRQCYLIGQYNYEVLISLKLYDKDGYAYVPDPLYSYREHEGQASVLGSKWDDIVKSIGYEVSDFDRNNGRYTYGYISNRELKEEVRKRICEEADMQVEQHDYEYIPMSPPFCKPYFKYLHDRFGGNELVGAEVGIFDADGPMSTLELCELNIVRYYLIDPYTAYSEFNQDKLDEVFHIANDRLRKYGDRVVMLWTTSRVAVNHILEGLDFVYIDGDHSYNGVMTDCNLFIHKIKPGGILGGHDYDADTSGPFPGVRDAVNEFCNTHGYTLHYNKPEWWIIKGESI